MDKFEFKTGVICVLVWSVLCSAGEGPQRGGECPAPHVPEVPTVPGAVWPELGEEQPHKHTYQNTQRRDSNNTKGHQITTATILSFQFSTRLDRRPHVCE